MLFSLIRPCAECAHFVHLTGGQVYRDFATFNTVNAAPATFHFKTNIAIQTNTMFRIVAEGFNYGLRVFIY